jgi:hypothetical protein
VSVAAVAVTLRAEPVTTTGAANVVKIPSAPRLVPAAFAATSR